MMADDALLSFTMLQVEFLLGDRSVAEHYVLTEDLRAQPQEFIVQQLVEIGSRSRSNLKTLKYKDSEGDWCTLTPETWHDAICFIAPIEDGCGKLQLQMEPGEAPPAAAPASATPEAPRAPPVATMVGADLKVDLDPNEPENHINVSFFKAPAKPYDQLFERLYREAEEVLSHSMPVTVKALQYADEDEDWCTLTEATLDDALGFAISGQEGTLLRLRAAVHPKVPPAEPAAASSGPALAAVKTEARPPTASLADVVLLELNRLGQGSDMRELVPRLAEAALRVVQEAQEPALYQFIDVLMAAQERRLRAEELPAHLPAVVQVVQSLPGDMIARWGPQLNTELDKAAAQLRSETGGHAQPVEVHPNVVCDGCQVSPIVGPRFRSLVRQDYDLCESCMKKKENEREGGFCQIKSEILADVETSYYPTGSQAAAAAAQEETPGLVTVAMSGGHDEEMPQQPPLPLPTPEEAAPVPAAVPTQEKQQEEEEEDDAAEMEVEEAKQRVANLDPRVCAAALTALLTHDSRAVCFAAEVAIAAAIEAAQAEAAPAAPTAKAAEEAPAPAATVQDGRDDDAMDTTMAEEAPPSAKVMAAQPLELGGDGCMEQEPEAIGDVTEEMQEIVAASKARQAFRIGRLAVAGIDGTDAGLLVASKVVVSNDGSVPWPDTVILTCLAGDNYGFPCMPLGSLQVGECAEIVLDLVVPVSRGSGGARHSMWALLDAPTGTLLGPILCLEVIHQE